jgi:hypothetical protein
VLGIVEATVGHDTPYAARMFCARSHSPVNGALLKLGCEAERDRGPRLVRLGSAVETLEYSCRDRYMLYEPTFSERKRAAQETCAEILILVP